MPAPQIRPSTIGAI